MRVIKRVFLGLAAVAVVLSVIWWKSAEARRQKVVSTQVRDEGLVATYFRPKGAGTVPAVIVLGGSEGGTPTSFAYRLAEQGWGALAVAYFGAEGVPKALANIPLEYFDLGIRWLGRQPNLDISGLAVVGTSRGGELALLLASHRPVFKRVVAIVPSSVVWGPIGRPSNKTDSAWTLNGNPLPFVRFAQKPSNIPRPHVGTADFLGGLEHREWVEAARIPVEDIEGSVLLLSGDDDQLWPSTLMSRQVMERLEAAHHPYHFEHIAFPGAGHLIVKGCDPGRTEARHSTGVWITFGGTKAANRAAQEQGWKKILEFLKTDPRKKNE